jgi:hypothetical protein
MVLGVLKVWKAPVAGKVSEDSLEFQEIKEMKAQLGVLDLWASLESMDSRERLDRLGPKDPEAIMALKVLMGFLENLGSEVLEDPRVWTVSKDSKVMLEEMGIQDCLVFLVPREILDSRVWLEDLEN